MPAKLSTRARKLNPSATFRLARRAAELREQGKDVISFGLGEPDFDTPKAVRTAAHDAIESGKTHYTANEGIAPLRQAIRDAFEKDQGVSYEAKSEVLVTAGAKQAIANALLALVEEGDEVLVPAPYWLTYPEIVGFTDAAFKPVHTAAATGFELTIEELEKAVSKRSRLLILNSPNNPTGAVIARRRLKEIAAFVKQHDLLVISDEIYGPLTFGDESHSSITAVEAGMKERTIVCHGVSKAYAMTGWRLGYALAPAEIVSAMSKIQGHMTSNACSISQHAALAALQHCDADVEAMRVQFARRREILIERLGQVEGLTATPPDGAFYLFPSIATLLGKVSKGGVKLTGSSEFCQALLDEEQVSVVPGIEFGADDCFRISYAASEDALQKGCDRIARFVGSLTEG